MSHKLILGIIIQNTNWVWVYYISAGLTFLWWVGRFLGWRCSMYRVFLGVLPHFQYQNEKACRSEILKGIGSPKKYLTLAATHFHSGTETRRNRQKNHPLHNQGNGYKKSFIFVFRFGLWMVFFHDFPENDPFITGAVRHRVRVGDLYKLILIVWLIFFNKLGSRE